MDNENPPTLQPHIMYRGLYVKVAKQFDVDPSYVSRVASGQRRSREIEQALRVEIDAINQRAGLRAPSGQSPTREIIKKNRDRIMQQWLTYFMASPVMSRLRASSRNREAPIWPLVQEAMRMMKLTPDSMMLDKRAAAAKHAALRRRDGYPLPAVMEEYNLVKRALFDILENHLPEIGAHPLIRDMKQLNEVIDAQTMQAVDSYLHP